MKKLRYITLALSAAFSIAMANICHAAAVKKCTDEEWLQADAQLHKLDNWAAVENYYTQYKQCDDGYLAEGSADSISYLMAEKWQSLSELNTIIKRKGPKFEQFTLDHISEITGQERLQKLQMLSSRSCPKSLKPLCSKINKAATNANNSYYR